MNELFFKTLGTSKTSCTTSSWCTYIKVFLVDKKVSWVGHVTDQN
jgi:hypothetical protein